MAKKPPKPTDSESPRRARRNTDAAIERRREEVWRLKLSGRWSGATVQALAARWRISTRMIEMDLVAARETRTGILRGPDLEQLRAEIALGLKGVIDRGNAACSCRTCKGLGYLEVADGEPGQFTLCDRCAGSGTDPDADARILKEVRQAYMDLAELYDLRHQPPQVAVAVSTQTMDLGGLLATIGQAADVMRMLAPGAVLTIESDDTNTESK